MLSNVIGNASEAIEQVLEWAAMFMGGNPDEVLFTLNGEVFDEILDAQTRTVMINELDRGLIAKANYRRKLRQTDVIAPQRKDEDIDAEAEVSAPMVTRQLMDLGNGKPSSANPWSRQSARASRLDATPPDSSLQH